MADPGRGLFITNTRIGDTILTTGALAALHRRHPGLRFTVVAGPVAAPLFAETPYVERVIPLRKTRFSGHWLRLWLQLAGVNWSVIADMRGSGVSRLLAARKHHVRTTTRDDRRHKAEQAASVVRASIAEAKPVIHVSDITRVRVRARLPEGRLLALAPSANRVGKTWPIDRFADYLNAATRIGGPLSGWSVAILGGLEDAPAARRLQTALPDRRILDFTGEALLPTAALLGQSDLFVGNDSGLMHLAAAMNTPVVALFGPTDERLYGPWAVEHRIVRDPHARFEFGATSRTVSETECQMDGVTVTQVLEATADILRSAAPRPRLPVSGATAI
ncbi:glycosyltransferase family 9 protein [Brevundimonas sp.]|uniref:glycosyltransferase family 9 protein n=1 Tax=Brevundimonas sp. TaxID=1871086 RepID=UPI0025E370DF|nr:glycosyltransferase family 9 protein [Brevundimonas sp.]